MAGRKDKNTVDYFPHYCTPGKTLFILESKFSHLGYSVWFKTLELLGLSENHYIDLRDNTDKLYLISKLKITEIEFNDIYELLAQLGAIDKDLWTNKIIFSDNFVKNIADAYSRRNNLCMNKLDLCAHLGIKCIHKLDLCEQKYTKESKVKESKVNESKIGGKFSIPSIKEITDYCIERKNSVSPNKFFDYYESKGWLIGKNRMKNWKAAIRTWENNTNEEKPKVNEVQNKRVKLENYEFNKPK